jgi:hypothetical protein
MECPKDGGCGGDGYSPVPSTLTECANPMGGGGGGNVPLDPRRPRPMANALVNASMSNAPVPTELGARVGTVMPAGSTATEVILEVGAVQLADWNTCWLYRLATLSIFLWRGGNTIFLVISI